MIAVLGIKRLSILLALIVLNAGMAAVVYMYLAPELKKAERTLSSEKSKESKVRGDLADIEVEFQQLDSQRNEFDVLRERGFFSNQNRREAEAVFLAAKAQSGVGEAIVSVRPGKVVENEIAAKADHVLLESSIDVNLKAIDDIDIVSYVSFLEKNFPGHLTIDRFTVTRRANISDTILRAIAGGNTPGLVEGQLMMTWRTMVSREGYLTAPTSTQGGTF